MCPAAKRGTKTTSVVPTSISGLKVAVIVRRRRRRGGCLFFCLDRPSVMNDIERGRNERTDSSAAHGRRSRCATTARSGRAKPKQDEERFNKVLNQKCHSRTRDGRSVSHRESNREHEGSMDGRKAPVVPRPSRTLLQKGRHRSRR